MANLPATQAKSSSLEAREIQAYAELLFKGLGPAEIAKRLAPDDLKKRKRIRNRVRHLVYHDAELTTRVAARARAEFVLRLGPIVRRHIQRAERLGRAQDVKLAFEASGFHNPKVSHEHSGDVNIRLVIPRPEIAESTEPVVDAEVVEDE